MKKIHYILEAIIAILPFCKKKNAKEIREFSELVAEQYHFLATQLDKVLKDYFEVSAKVREMHVEIFKLNTQLAEALHLQCTTKECRERSL